MDASHRAKVYPKKNQKSRIESRKWNVAGGIRIMIHTDEFPHFPHPVRFFAFCSKGLNLFGVCVSPVYLPLSTFHSPTKT
jgi:hypothetical protein